MKYHLIAIGGSIMHNLAIDLQDLGHDVTGSDDEIFEPSKSRLSNKGLLPKHIGWDSTRITLDIDYIILGKHARSDNPELKKAQELGLRIMSFPEFIALNTKAKNRVAITGSHGKTSTTAMIMHVLNKAKIDFDYLVGANIEGFEKMVKISGAEILVVEGDEYPSSCLDNSAKMLHYNANISVVTGIAWDHVNIYKTYDEYKNIFHEYLIKQQNGSICYFDQTDEDLLRLVINNEYKTERVGYQALQVDKKGNVLFQDESYPIKIFGNHNLKNLSAAMLVCKELGIDSTSFLEQIGDFKGAAKRLELLAETKKFTVYKDFAHAPSKAEATCKAIRSKYPDAYVKGILELHTFSSLSIEFIEHYKGTLDSLDEVLVYFDPHALAIKKLPPLQLEELERIFKHKNLSIANEATEVSAFFANTQIDKTEILLIMSSGNLGGIDINNDLGLS